MRRNNIDKIFDIEDELGFHYKLLLQILSVSILKEENFKKAKIQVDSILECFYHLESLVTIRCKEPKDVK